MTEHEHQDNPYVGLRPFHRADSLYFFGRRQQNAELLESLYDSHFLAVVGSSGCGKSSLIRAGLIPGLLGGFLVEERDAWRIGVMRPGDAPLRNLAAALCGGDGDGDGDAADDAAVDRLLEEVSNRHTEALVDHIVPILGESTNQLLLIDQFEEIFAFRGSDDYRKADLGREQRRERRQRRSEAADFVDLVIALSARDDLPLYTVLTMRTDFLGDCDLFYGLPEAMNRGRYLVPRLDRQQLREAIEGPALLSGAQMAPRLLDLLLNELGDRSDRLPVLQHALLRTWDDWNEKGGEGPIDIEHYEACGTLESALSRHAEEALRDHDREGTERIFRRLTDTDAGGRKVRRPSTLSDLIAVSGLDKPEVEAILQRFSEGGRHFVFVSEGADRDDPRVDISHESLIRRWGTLRDWVDAERDSRDHFVDLVTRARRHEYGEAAVLQDPDLQIKLDWRKDQSPSETWASRYAWKRDDYELAMNYLDESRRARRRRRRNLIGSCLAAVAIVLGFLAFIQAQRQRRLDEGLISEARELLATDPTKAAVKLRNVSSLDARGMLSMAGALNFGFFEKDFDGHDGPVRSVSFSPDGKRILSASEDGTARIWKLDQPRAEALELHSDRDDPGPRTALAFNSYATQVVAASEDGSIELWSIPDVLDADNLTVSGLTCNDESDADPLVLRGHTARVNSAVFSPNGELLLTASDDRTARIWPLTGAGAAAVLQGHTGSVLAASFSSDGEWAVTASADGTARVWEVATARELLRLTGHEDAVVAASIGSAGGDGSSSDDRRLILTASRDGTARVWNALAGFTTLDSRVGPLTHAEFSADGSFVVTASADGWTTAWRVPALELERTRDRPPQEEDEGVEPEPERPLARWSHGRTAVLDAELIGDCPAGSSLPPGCRVLTLAGDGVARLWTPGSEVPVAFSGEVRSVGFDPRTGDVVTAGAAGVRLWTQTGEPLDRQPRTRDGQTYERVTLSPPHARRVRLVASTPEGAVHLWRAEEPQDRCGVWLKSQGLTASMNGAWFGPKGGVAVTIAGGEARLWDGDDGTLIRTLRGHRATLNWAAFDPEGDLVATASDDGTTRIWRVPTRRGDSPRDGSVAVLESGDGEAAVHAAFSPDGNRLVVSSAGGMARVWRQRQGDWGPEHEFELQHRGAVTFAAFDAAGERVVTASRDKVARIWSLESDLPPPIELEGHEKPIYVARFNADGTRVVTASRDLTARVWRADGFESEPLELIGHEGPLTAASFSADGDTVLTASEDGTARLWQADGSDRRNPVVLLRYGGPVHAAAFSPSGERVATASHNGRVQIWGIERVGVPTRVLEQHRGDVFAASFDRKGNKVVTASEDGTAMLWAYGGPEPTFHRLDGPSGRGSAVAFSPDGRRIAIAMRDGTARIWSIDGAEALPTFGEPGTGLTDLDFSADGSRLATAASDGWVRVWEVEAGPGAKRAKEPLLELEAHRRGVGSVAFSPADAAGRYLVTASVDGSVRVWNTQTAREENRRDSWPPLPPSVTDPEAEPSARAYLRRKPIWRARFGPEGRRVAVGSLDGGLWVWTPASAAEPLLLQEPRVRGEPIVEAVFNSAGDRVVSVDRQGLVKLWDAGSGELLGTIEKSADWAPTFAFDSQRADQLLAVALDIEAESPVIAARFSSDGKTVATVSADGAVMVHGAGEPGAEAAGGASGTLGVRVAPCVRKPIVLAGPEGDVLAATVRPDGKRVWTVSNYGLREWVVHRSGPPTFKKQDYLGLKTRARLAFFDAGATRLVLLDGTCRAHVWPMDPDGQPVELSDPEEGCPEEAAGSAAEENAPSVRTAVFSQDGRRVVTGSEDGTVRMYDAVTGALTARLGSERGGHYFAIRNLSFSPDDEMVVTASEDGTARLWRVDDEDSDWEPFATLSGHRFPVQSARFSTDGTQVITASDDGTARIWNLREETLHELRGHGGKVVAASFGPDDRKVVTASEDGTGRVWLVDSFCSLEPGRCSGEGDSIVLVGHRAPILTAAFDAGGGKIVTSSSDGTARVWFLSTNDLREAIQDAIPEAMGR